MFLSTREEVLAKFWKLFGSGVRRRSVLSECSHILQSNYLKTESINICYINIAKVKTIIVAAATAAALTCKRIKLIARVCASVIA